MLKTTNGVGAICKKKGESRLRLIEEKKKKKRSCLADWREKKNENLKVLFFLNFQNGEL
jgi:hypothetical protein